MRLTPGTRLGPFEIIAPIGAGGMGEVYRARDGRLARNVAIKVLPAALSADADRLQRFEQEARAASALNHPNIVTIYELGREGASHYIAMELVEGKTVRELLTARSLSMRRILELAAQTAEGLTKAHEAGITHRDLKPENLMISSDGFVKILDFGLAKLSTQPESVDDTITTAESTAVGLLLGTVGYMSPEQAAGARLDFRSDQFSFGVVLYELVTGKRAFQRSTAAETLVAILRERPEPLGGQNTGAPSPLCWAIERCMSKEPEKRYASTRELARELAAIRDRYSDNVLAQAAIPVANLPVSRTGFVGREREIESARELLRRPEVHLVTITGTGGIGKTRFSIELINTLAEEFFGGIHLVQLSPLRDPGMILSAIVQTLGIREPGAQPALEVLKAYFQDSMREQTLLVLDNFEHLLQAAPTVSELLAVAPNLKIVVTSRAALRVYAEHEFPVPPLALPDSRTFSLETLAEIPSVALFVQRACAAKPGFELSSENAPAVIEICARLDGLPLAIELAAARVKVLSPSAMLSRLASRLQLLTGGARDLPERQQTLRAAMDWSYDLLSPEEQKLFRRLSVFADGCNLESVEAICNAKADLDLELLDGMASLLDKSLLHHGEPFAGESRYSLLETVREYAADKLQSSGEFVQTKRAHAAYCLVLAEEGASDQAAVQSAAWVSRFEVEHNNFRAALQWLTETGDADWGLRLGTALFRFWEIREYFAEGRDRLAKLLRLPGSAAPTKARNRALFAAGVLAAAQGDYAAGEPLIRESQQIARQLNDITGVAVSLNALAVFARDRDDIGAASRLFAESLALWRESGNLKAVARALSNLANVAKLQGDFDRAHALYAECLSIFRGLGDRTGVGWSLNYQGDVARDQGDATAAHQLYEQSLSIFRELGDRWGVAGTLADLGNLAAVQRKVATAHLLYRESLKLFRELDHKRGIARLLECFASSTAAQDQAERSLRLAGAAAALRHRIGAPLTPAEQTKLDAGLDAARKSLVNDAGVAAWLEGWALPIDQAVEEILTPSADSSP